MVIKKYNLALTVVEGKGLFATRLLNSVFKGHLIIEAEEKVLIENKGLINVSGTIEHKNEEDIAPIEFKEKVNISTNIMQIKKDVKQGSISIEASIDNLVSNPNINNLKIEITNTSLSNIMFKSLTLHGKANQTEEEKK